MTSPILSTGTLMVMIRGAFGLISPGASMASRITSRIASRAPLACLSAAPSTDAGMPSSLVSSCSAVDVGQRDVLVALVDQPHRDAGDHLPERHAGVQQGHGGGADRTH